MLDLAAGYVETATEPQAWRIDFVEDSTFAPHGVETIEIAEPRNVTAVLIPMSLSLALEQTSPHDGILTVVWMPPSVDRGSTVQREAEEWMRQAGEKRKEARVRADVRTLRAVWDESRALIYASASDIRYALDAIVRFSVAQKEAHALETTMKSAWASIEADAGLTHAVTKRQQKRQRHVNEMTEIATRMKVTWLRVSRSLEQLDPAIPAPSKRLFAELVSASSLFDRVEMLEDPVQFALDHYEISNTRLIETGLARTERLSSIFGYGIIIVLLLIQLAIMWPR